MTVVSDQLVLEKQQKPRTRLECHVRRAELRQRIIHPTRDRRDAPCPRDRSDASVRAGTRRGAIKAILDILSTNLRIRLFSVSRWTRSRHRVAASGIGRLSIVPGSNKQDDIVSVQRFTHHRWMKSFPR